MMPKAFLELGAEIILCSEGCKGIKNSKEEGIIPRVLILSTLQGKPSREKAKIGIFGINPGPHLPFERLYYRDILKKHGLLTAEYNKSNAIKAFKEIHDIWVSEFIRNYRNYPSHYRYFANILELIKKAKDCFNLREEDTILLGELVYCESKNVRVPLPTETLQKCIEKFLGRVLDFIEGDLILCLGWESYEIMKKLTKKRKIHEKIFPDIAEKLKNKKILGLYHPTGSPKFYSYFKDNKKPVTERSLNPELCETIKDFLKSSKRYGFIKKENNALKIVE